MSNPRFAASISRFIVAAACVCLLVVAGCGGPSAKVKGRVTCQGKPVAGMILFSPKGEGATNTGPAVNGELKADGTYEVVLKSVGLHNIVITPADVKYPVPPGEFEHPCDRSPVERDIKAGDNDVSIEMKTRTQ